jgi:sugar-specific transcriptional regulator TrmB
MELNKLLIKYGLTERETTVLISLYSLLDATSFKISKATGIPKTTIYDILESLKNKNLVNSWKKNNITYYFCESPKQLIKTLEDKISLARDIIPELQILSSKEAGPSTKMYSGENGVKIVFEDVLETAKTEKVFVIEAVFTAEFVKYLPKYMTKWMQKREELNIKVKILQPNEFSGIKFGYENNNFRETKTMTNDFPINGDMIIYGSKTAFFSAKNNEMYSIIIESDTFTKIIAELFRSTWQNINN